MERKIIKLRTRGGNRVQIIHQSHIGEEFGVRGSNRFKVNNGMLLISFWMPAISNNSVVYMRGSHSENDDRILEFGNHISLERFVEAVKEYNEYFSSGTLAHERCCFVVACKECMKNPKELVNF